MRPRIYDTTAERVPISLELNADLIAKVRAAGLNAAAIAEKALVEALKQRIREEIAEEMRFYRQFVEEHGSFADMIREHNAKMDADEAV